METSSAPRSRQLLRRVLIGGSLVALTAVGALGAGLAALWKTTPDPAAVALKSAAAPSRIVAADGTLLATIGSRVQQPVALHQVSPHIVQALLVTEDRRFFDHAGIDLRRTAGALWANAGGARQGGSTLTQQLARNLFPEAVGNDRSLLRKLREMVVALKIERAYAKPDILLMYLNQVPFLYNVTGIEMAAQTYFGRSAADVEPHQAALLVAMLKGPRQYDPQRAPERARQRRDMVLALMARHGGAGIDVAAQQAEPLALQLQRRDLEPTLAPHYMLQARRAAIDWAAANDIDLARAGLTIHTTLDTQLQALAERAVERQGALLQASAAKAWSKAAADGSFSRLWTERPDLLAELVRQTPAYQRARDAGADDADALRRGLADRDALLALQRDKTRLEAGFVALDPRSGAVLAYVGSRDYAVDRYDHVAVAQRQPGSTFKAFVYGAALRNGISETAEYADDPVEYVQADGSVWQPRDVDGSSGETYTLRRAFAKSKNTVTAQVMQQVGVHNVIRFARDLGIERATLMPVPSLALGTSPVTLLEMVRAYGTIAALGVKRQPLLMTHVSDARGTELHRFASAPQRVLDEERAVLLVDLMRDAVNKGTGSWLRTRYDVRGDVAGKTGTTQNNADGWFIAMRPGLVAGAWVGFNDQRVTLRGGTWGQGGRSALSIVGDFMRHAVASPGDDERFPVPPPPPAAPEPAWDDDGAGDSGDAAATSAPMLLTAAWHGSDAPNAPPLPVAAAAAVTPAAVVVPELPLASASALP